MSHRLTQRVYWIASCFFIHFICFYPYPFSLGSVRVGTNEANKNSLSKTANEDSMSKCMPGTGILRTDWSVLLMFFVIRVCYFACMLLFIDMFISFSMQFFNGFIKKKMVCNFIYLAFGKSPPTPLNLKQKPLDSKYYT